MPTSSHLSVHQALDDLLQRIGSAILPAEAHGLLCGLLCAAREAVHEVWMTQLAGEGVLDLEEAERLRAVVDATAAQLEDPDLGFDLVLPDDESPLDERATALGEWCHGFIVGFGLGQGEEGVNDTVREVLEDLAEISQVSAQPEDCQTEEDEDSYAELVEYVRVAVLLVNEHLLRPPPPAQEPPLLH